jgi:hypothetical protein
MLGALDLDTRAQDGAEEGELGAAEALAGPGGDADRAVILAEEEAAVRRRGDLGHIAFLAAQRRETPEPPAEIAAAEPRAVELEARLLSGRDQPVEPFFAEEAANGLDQIQRQAGMAVGKAAMALLGEAPAPPRAADARRLILEGDETLSLQLRQMLADRDARYTEAACDHRRALRPGGFERMEQTGGAAWLHLLLLARLVQFGKDLLSLSIGDIPEP